MAEYRVPDNKPLDNVSVFDYRIFCFPVENLICLNLKVCFPDNNIEFFKTGMLYKISVCSFFIHGFYLKSGTDVSGHNLKKYLSVMPDIKSLTISAGSWVAW